MAESSTHINYTFEDVQRYLQGEMSAAEMHDMEKASLHDSFLADAIEGYSTVSAIKAKQHLNEINASITGEKKNAKVVAFNRKIKWLNIAALIIILSGIAVIVSLFSKSSNQQIQVAQIKNETIRNENLKDSATDKMNTLTQQQDTSLFIAENKSQKKLQSIEKRKAAVPVISSDNNVPENNLEKDEVDVTNIAAASPAPIAKSKAIEPVASANLAAFDTVQLDTRSRTANNLPNTFSGKVVDENNKPIPYATIESDDKKTAVVTDLNGDFIIQKNDSLMNVTASTMGYDSKNVNLKSGNNAPIILSGVNSSLNEVVVTALGNAKKLKPGNKPAEPIGGWQNFNNYVTTELSKDTTNETMNFNELVEIEFLIDKNGSPYNFKIIKSLDQKHSAKAIELLKSGPKWTNTLKNKKARITIRF